MNHTLEVINNRSSLRKFDPRPISPEDQTMIIQAGLRAPTAGNMMLYSILAIKDHETKDTLAKTCDNQPFIGNAPLVLVYLADLQRWFDYYQISDVEGYCKEHDLEFAGPNLGDLFIASSDALIAAENTVIAAESLGIGSCYIGDIMENYETHRELFGLPDFTFPIAMLCLGYYPSGNKPKPRERFASEYIVHEEKYHRLSVDQLTAMFASREKQVSGNNQYQAKNFGQFMYARKTGASFFKEMHRSIGEAMKHWQGKAIRK